MKAEGKRKPLLLKRSIGARILLTVLLILTGVMIVLQSYMREMVSRYVEEYYTRTGELISVLTSGEIQNYLGNLSSFENSPEAEELLDLCGRNNIYSLWVETSEPPYEVAENQIYLPISDLIKDKEHKPHQKYKTQEVEKDIFTGNVRLGRYRYQSTNGYEIISYLHGIYDRKGECIAVVGVNFEEESIHRDAEYSAFRVCWIIRAIFIGLMVVLGMFLHLSIFKPLRKISSRMRDYASRDQLNPDKLEVKGEDELSRMAASYNKMTDEISAYMKRVGELEKERLTSEAEMNVAAQIQAGMLPPDTYSCDQIQIEAVMKPAKEVAGDFYDYLTLPDGRMFFCIADVSGKGVSAALYMAEAENVIRYNAALCSSPAQIMYAANNDLCARNPEKLFVTAFAAIYDPAAGTLTYCNAGHNPAYITGVGSTEVLGGADCLLLGLFPDEEYTDNTIEITAGHTLFLYTDGLTEAVDPDRNMFGKDRMEQELEKYASNAVSTTLVREMTESVKAFVKGAESHDDLTMLAVRFGRIAVLPARTDENAALREFLQEETGLTGSEKKKICLVAEEIFVNICCYAYNGKEPGTVRISTLLTGEEFILSFADTGTPYNPLENVIDPEEYNPDEQIGGLGKLMSFTIMDRQNYEYRNGYNVLTLRYCK